MNIYKIYTKIIILISFVIIFLFTPQAKSLDKFNKADRISDYFSGILLHNEYQYSQSLNYLKKLNGLETNHTRYSVKYLNSLVNSGNFKKAFDYSKKLEKKKLETVESLLITGIFYLKNSNIDLAKKYFLKAKRKNSFILTSYLSQSLFNWSNLVNYDLNQATQELKKLDDRFENLKKYKMFS